MRTKTDEKRREIEAAAAELFIELGYDRTSMSAISARVGGSKATLYSYFASKEDLLRAVLADSVAEHTDQLLQEFAPGENLRDAFIDTGIKFLTRRLSALTIASLRILANQPEETGLGVEYYTVSLKSGWGRFADRLALLMEEGRLRKADPWTAAMHWKGLHEGELLEKRLLGATTGQDMAEVSNIVVAAVDAFLRIYAPEA